ncbi:MAG: HNH endonuclease [Planctomycetes bacterium]|nr:HNH endonuclease [Planctomycetota bacterium]
MIANTQQPLGSLAAEVDRVCDGQSESKEQACRSMAPRAHMLHNSAGHSMRSQWDSPEEKESDESLYGQLGSSYVERTESSDHEGTESSEKGGLGLRTQAEMDILEDEIAAISKDFVLRPSRLVRLLNSTTLGEVICERKLHRHRQRAPMIHVGSKYINLITYCAWMHVQRHNPKRSIRRRRVGNLDVITLGELREILESQQFRCALTNDQLTPDNFALDHIVPLSEGGDFSKSNCQIVTANVNRAKNTMSQEAFIAMCIRVAKHQSELGK